jgi:hypothetical protein
MQQQTENPAAATQSQGVDTGPDVEAITPAPANIDDGAVGAKPRECSAVIMLHISRDRIAIVATLDMGGLQSVTRTFTRDPNGGWRTQQPNFIVAEERIGVELAEYLDALNLPTRVAAMLPRPATAAGCTAMAKAAQEVRRA